MVHTALVIHIVEDFPHIHILTRLRVSCIQHLVILRVVLGLGKIVIVARLDHCGWRPKAVAQAHRQLSWDRVAYLHVPETATICGYVAYKLFLAAVAAKIARPDTGQHGIRLAVGHGHVRR